MRLIYGISIVVIALFYGSYFAKMAFQRSRGIVTNRMGKGAKPKRTRIIETILMAATCSMAVVQIVSMCIGAKGFSLLQAAAIRSTGLCVALFGTAIFIISMATMKNSWRAGVDMSQQTQLICNGIYGFSRNPAFLGFDLFYVGFTLAYCNAGTIFFLVLCVVALHLQILEEEKILPLVFGKEYLAYKKSVSRYFSIPRQPEL